VGVLVQPWPLGLPVGAGCRSGRDGIRARQEKRLEWLQIVNINENYG